MNNVEKMLVSNETDSFVVDVETATQAIYDLWERHFSTDDVPAIDAHDAKTIGVTLRLVHGCLFDALRDFRLSVGEDGAGVEFAVALVHEYEQVNKKTGVV